ncbi:hypothetical protein L7F22_058458 [Adiantum nelumboides]|nr:hypothetical protein [Adiantum nelumboides]
MLQIGNTLGKLPSQRLKPEIVGLKRKLTGKLTPASVSAPPDWKGQEVLVTLVIGKLRLHVQGYVDKEDFFISPLKHEDVILEAPWFDVNSAGSTIPVVPTQVFDKVIKGSISCYMVFVKESKEGAGVLKELCSETKEESKLYELLNEIQDVFTDGIPSKLPSTRGQDVIP